VKVLWLLPHRPRGAPSGGDLYDAQVVAGLLELGHRVQVTAKLPDPRRVRADVVVQDALGFARFFRFNRALERAGCKARRVALVHVTTARLSPQSGTAQREAQYLASTHAAVFVSRQARAESLRLLRHATSLRLRSLKTAVIPPGADRLAPQRRVPRAARAPLRLLCVGHLLPHKGQLALLDAFAA
jgi:glycosyltransferase involved in cell wall biosynthesis